MGNDAWQARKSEWHPSSKDVRSPWDIDYGRIVHSSSFRRLQGKTQILSLGDGDFYRNRLTHSIEVAQIASGLVNHLKNNKNEEASSHLPSSSLIQAVSSAHDLGHPPFGHGGEVALNHCMKEHGGFEGNGQTLRILTKLEKFSDNDGANLCRRTLLGILKYPVQYSKILDKNPKPKTEETKKTESSYVSLPKPPKCYLDTEKDVVDWILSPVQESERKEFTKIIEGCNKKWSSVHKSLDCSIMELADDISYGVHDLEDAIETRLLSEKYFKKIANQEFFSDFIREKELKNFDEFIERLFRNGKSRKRVISWLVGYFIQSVEFKENFGFQEPLLKWSVCLTDQPKELLDHLKKMVKENVICSSRVQQLEFKGKHMVKEVFEAIASDPNHLLPEEKRQSYKELKERAICDFVSGMTDSYLMKTYERLFSPRMGSVFDML